MSKITGLYKSMISNMEVPGLKIPVTFIKFYRGNDVIPPEIAEYEIKGVTFTSCQANKQAGLGDDILLTKNNIGCIAAAISFGIVDKNDDKSLSGGRVYTDIMKDQSNDKKHFNPPSPKDFTDGLVYACHDAGKPDFCLFGENDSGRFKTVDIAKKALSDMMTIDPADTKGVFFFSATFEDIDIEPDVVVLSVRPVELIRIIQAYKFLTGERVIASMGSVRVVNSDLIVRPYLTGKINVSSYCIGARLIAKYEANLLGIGIPYEVFKTVVKGMEESKTGYPFNQYPRVKDFK